MARSPYLFPAIIFHVNLILGALSYALGDVGPNGIAGIRTSRTMSDPEAWRSAHAEMRR